MGPARLHRPQSTGAGAGDMPGTSTPVGTALGVHEPPWRWTATETAVDFVDKLVLAQATGLIFDRMAKRRPASA